MIQFILESIKLKLKNWIVAVCDSPLRNLNFSLWAIGNKRFLSQKMRTVLWENNSSGSSLGDSWEKGGTKRRDKVRNSQASEFQTSKICRNFKGRHEDYQHLGGQQRKETDKTVAKEGLTSTGSSLPYSTSIGGCFSFSCCGVGTALLAH